MTLEHFDSILAFVLIITGVSLIITALNQIVSALLGLRGAHLRWGLETLLANMDPELKNHVQEISEAVLHHPLISDSSFSRWNLWIFRRWKLASAIRTDELIEILRHLAKSAPDVPAADGKDACKVVLKHAIGKFEPNAASDLFLVSSALKQVFPNQADKTQALMASFVDSSQSLPGKIEKWFDSVMDRSSQRFTLHMRLWTVLFAVILAFGFQLDAFALFQRVSSDAQLRTSIIASADALTKRANDLLAVSTNNASPDYVMAMSQLTNEIKGLAAPHGFSNLHGGKLWLAAELKRLNVQDSEHWMQKFEDAVPQATLRGEAESLHSLMTDQLLVQLLPASYPDPIYRDWSPKHRTLWGIVVSAVLLSLGAPFWFNVLKNLSNLRPLLAKKEERETSPTHT